MTHTHAAFAAFLALTLTCVGSPSADAAVLPLYSEQVSGDIDTPLHQFALPSGVSSVSGEVSLYYAGGPGVVVDYDQFRFTVSDGLQVNRISVDYLAGATAGSAFMTVRHAYRNDIATLAAPISELSPVLHPGDSGVESLFDLSASFVPIVGGASVRLMSVGIDSAGLPANTGMTYWYTLYFDVGPVTSAATVPEPSALHLATTALGLCGLIPALPGLRNRRKTRGHRVTP